MVDRVTASNGNSLTPEMCKFISEQPMFYVASMDASGQPTASVIFGTPGFVQCDDSSELFINPGESSFSDLSGHIKPGSNVALLFMEPATRRRVRLDGLAELLSEGRIRFEIRRSLRTFPKYIHSREVRWVGFDPAGTSQRLLGSELTPAHRQLIAGSDTFFIATHHSAAHPDISHRAGRPGFVRFISENELIFPDYPSDNIEQSGRNLTYDSRAGLLFLDCDGEGTLHVSGTARVRTDMPSCDLFGGGFPVIHFTATGWVQRRASLPVKLKLLHYSPFDPFHPSSF